MRLQNKAWQCQVEVCVRLTFVAAKMDGEIIPGLLASIRKATSECREYGKGKPQKTRG